MLRNAVGGVSAFPKKSVRVNIISVPEGVGGDQISRKKALRTLERPLG